MQLRLRRHRNRIAGSRSLSDAPGWARSRRSHGNTVKNTEYFFLTNLFAARGYLVVSIQHDLPTDPPMVTKPGEPYVGRLPQILRGVANIKFAVQEMQKVKPNADYDHLTVVGHSMGGDITMYFAKQYPDEVKKVVTLDNLRVPFITSGKFKILSFRSKDPQFKTDLSLVFWRRLDWSSY